MNYTTPATLAQLAYLKSRGGKGINPHLTHEDAVRIAGYIEWNIRGRMLGVPVTQGAIPMSPEGRAYIEAHADHPKEDQV